METRKNRRGKEREGGGKEMKVSEDVGGVHWRAVNTLTGLLRPLGLCPSLQERNRGRGEEREDWTKEKAVGRAPEGC